MWREMGNDREAASDRGQQARDTESDGRGHYELGSMHVPDSPSLQHPTSSLWWSERQVPR